MMGLQFGLTARFRLVTKPWGEDVIYHFHRRISLIAVALVFAHPLIIFAAQPELLARPEDAVAGAVPHHRPSVLVQRRSARRTAWR